MGLPRDLGAWRWQGDEVCLPLDLPSLRGTLLQVVGCDRLFHCPYRHFPCVALAMELAVLMSKGLHLPGSGVRW